MPQKRHSLGPTVARHRRWLEQVGWRSSDTKTMADVLAPAIRYAEQGFPCRRKVVSGGFWARQRKKTLSERRAHGEGTYLPQTGQRGPRRRARVFSQSRARVDIQTARLIRPATAFYRGEIAKKILASSASHGGTMAAGGPWRTSRASGVDPISTTYHGWTVHELPPKRAGASRR